MDQIIRTFIEYPILAVFMVGLAVMSYLHWHAGI
jgi:hypothetical protein